MTGGTGAASKKQTTNAGSQFGNAWAQVHPPGYRSSDTKPGPLQSPGNTNRERIGSVICTRCSAWFGELGSEPTPALFVAHLVEVFQEVKRVLRDDGVCFLNIGDSYSTGNPPGRRDTSNGKYGPVAVQPGSFDRALSYRGGTRPKSLLLVPERLAIALSDDGWVIRSRIAWCKAAPMPESAKDRPTSAWEHLWMLTKQGRYFWDHTAIQEPCSENTHDRGSGIGVKNALIEYDGKTKHNEDYAHAINGAVSTRNPRNYWVLNPDPYSGAHFATFPKELPRRCIAAATSEYGACAACGAAWKRVVERGLVGSLVQETYAYAPPVQKPERRHQSSPRANANNRHEHGLGFGKTTTTTGWAATCKCGPAAGVRPCVVLDPFSGSGTTAFVAASMGRVGVGVELSAKYTAQARYGRLAQDFLPFDAPAPEPEPPRLPLDDVGPGRPQARRALEIYHNSALTPAHLNAIRAVGITDVGKAQVTQSGYGKNTEDIQRLAAEAKAVLKGYYREFLSGELANRASTSPYDSNPADLLLDFAAPPQPAAPRLPFDATEAQA